MKIDFKRELEAASRSMIMVHDHKLLINLIVRMLVNKLNVKHAGMILFDPEKNTYVLNISRGESGVKIPKGFARFNYNSPIIKFFNTKEYRPLTLDRNAVLSEDINKIIWRESVFDNCGQAKLADLLHKVDEQMHMLNSVACVPAYYQDNLLAVLLLGEKQDCEKFEQGELDFLSAIASNAAMAIRNAQLFEGMKSESEKNRKQFIQTIVVLSSTIEAKDTYTHGHTERVTRISKDIARQMENNGTMRFPETFHENLYIGALMHDIGKIGAPEVILNKKEKLTQKEFCIMKNHPGRGSEMVAPLSLHQECIDGIRHHHERYDGKGYPDGLKGEEIPIVASIIAVADAYDAMTSDRPYRKAMSAKKAIKEIEKHIGEQFHPKAAKALIEIYRKGEL